MISRLFAQMVVFAFAGKTVPWLGLFACAIMSLVGCTNNATKDKKGTAENVAEQVPDASEKEIRESLSKLDAGDRLVAESQKLCPITGQPLGSMGVPLKVTIKGEPVFLCCDGCNDRALSEPEKTLAKVRSLREKNKKAPK